MARKTQVDSLASSLKSANDLSEATDLDLIIDSGSTDNVIVHKNWVKNLKELNKVFTNPDEGKTKVLGIGEVVVLAKDIQGKALPLVLKNALIVPGYRTNLVSVSSVFDKGHKIVHQKGKSLLCLTQKNDSYREKGKLFFLQTTPQHGNHVANLSGGPSQLDLWHKRFGHLNYRDLKFLVPIELKDEIAKCETCCLTKIVKTPVPKQNGNRQNSQFHPKSRKHFFLGYDSNSTAYFLQDIATRKLTRARNVIFDETKVVGFKNETKDIEDDLLFDISFDEESVEPDNQIVVKSEIKDENSSEPLIDTKNEEREDSSLSGENQIQIESTNSANIVPEVSLRKPSAPRNIRSNPEVQVQPINPKTSSGPSPPRPSRTPVPKERPHLASDVQQTLQTVQSKKKSQAH